MTGMEKGRLLDLPPVELVAREFVALLQDQAKSLPDLECQPEQTDIWQASEILERCADVLTALKQENERLTQANAALMDERTSLVETKREQIERLGKELDDWKGKWAEADEAQIVANEFLAIDTARIRVMEDALRPFADDDDMVGVNSDYTNARAALDAKP